MYVHTTFSDVELVTDSAVLLQCVGADISVQSSLYIAPTGLTSRFSFLKTGVDLSMMGTEAPCKYYAIELRC